MLQIIPALNPVAKNGDLSIQMTDLFAKPLSDEFCNAPLIFFYLW